jgi:hypothetical protein
MIQRYSDHAADERFYRPSHRKGRTAQFTWLDFRKRGGFSFYCNRRCDDRHFWVPSTGERFDLALALLLGLLGASLFLYLSRTVVPVV